MKKTFKSLLFLALLSSCKRNETKPPQSNTIEFVANPDSLKTEQQAIGESDSLTTAQARELVLKAKKDNLAFFSSPLSQGLPLKNPTNNQTKERHCWVRLPNHKCRKHGF